MKSLDICRRDGNGWQEAQGVEADSMAQGRLRRVRYRLGGFWCIGRPQSKLLVINFLSKVKQSVMMGSDLNSRKSIPSQGIGKLKGFEY